MKFRTGKIAILMASLFLLVGCSDNKITVKNFNKYFEASAKIKNLWMNCDVDLVFSSSAIDCTIKKDVHISANFEFRLKDGTFLEKTNSYEFVIAKGTLSCTKEFKYTITYATSDKIKSYGKKNGYTYYQDGVEINTIVINVSGEIKK